MQKSENETNMLPHQNLSKSSHHFKKLRSTSPEFGFLVDPIFDSKSWDFCWSQSNWSREIQGDNKVPGSWQTQNSSSINVVSRLQLL